MREKTTILILTANPKNTDRLRIDEEVREIRDTLKSSSFRERFDVQDRLAVRPKDIQQALLDVQPQIVQFSGHGAQDGLMIENNSGEEILARPEALGNLFKLFPGQVECVFLNACFSQPQAEAIAAHEQIDREYERAWQMMLEHLDKQALTIIDLRERLWSAEQATKAPWAEAEGESKCTR